jgi:two-component system phosphate regulon response regulator PhoB
MMRAVSSGAPAATKGIARGGARAIVALRPDRGTGCLPIPAHLIAAFESVGWAVEWSGAQVDTIHAAAIPYPAVLLVAVQRIDPDLRAGLGRLRNAPAAARPLIVALGAGVDPELCVKLLDSLADLAFPFEASADWICRQVRSVVDLIDPPAAEESVTLGALTLNHSIKRVILARDGRRQETTLSPTECRIVGALMARPYRAFDRGELLQAVWGADSPIDLRTVDVHIRRLRSALARIGCEAMLQTVRGVGYRLVPG